MTEDARVHVVNALSRRVIAFDDLAQRPGKTLRHQGLPDVVTRQHHQPIIRRLPDNQRTVPTVFPQRLPDPEDVATSRSVRVGGERPQVYDFGAQVGDQSARPFLVFHEARMATVQAAEPLNPNSSQRILCDMTTSELIAPRIAVRLADSLPGRRTASCALHRRGLTLSIRRGFATSALCRDLEEFSRHMSQILDYRPDNAGKNPDALMLAVGSYASLLGRTFTWRLGVPSVLVVNRDHLKPEAFREWSLLCRAYGGVLVPRETAGDRIARRLGRV